MRQRERYIFRYTGEPEKAKQEFEVLQRQGGLKVLEETPSMILGETSPQAAARIQSANDAWLVTPLVSYDIPDHQVQVTRPKTKR